MAGIQQISRQMKAVKHIGKLTNTMKIIAQTKLFRVEREERMFNPVGQAIKHMVKVSGFNWDARTEKAVLVVTTSDKGLCGAVHGRVAKVARSFLDDSKRPYDLVVLGERGKNILLRQYGHLYRLVVSGVGKTMPTFLSASDICCELLVQFPYFDYGKIVFPWYFKRGFEFDQLDLFTSTVLNSNISALRYELDDTIEVICYFEFNNAFIIFFALLEQHTVELFSRISAMTTASQNAEELLEVLALEFNKRRQAVITKELFDIVSAVLVVLPGGSLRKYVTYVNDGVPVKYQIRLQQS